MFGNIYDKNVQIILDDLSTEILEDFNSFIVSQYQKSIFILKNGEIEDYITPGIKSINSFIDIVNNPETLKLWIESGGIPELISILSLNTRETL